MHYVYAMRGDGREPVRHVSAAEQQAALDALMASLKPSELALPSVRAERRFRRGHRATARTASCSRATPGRRSTRSRPPVVAADLVSQLLEPARAARLVTQRALDPTLPGLDTVIDRLRDAAAQQARAMRLRGGDRPRGPSTCSPST